MFPVKKTSVGIDSRVIVRERFAGEKKNQPTEHIYPVDERDGLAGSSR